MVDACLENCRQFPLSDLVCIEDVPQETQWGLLGKLHSVAGCALAQLEHCLGFLHCSHMCLYSWHLLQLAVLGVAYSTLMLAVFWPGDRLSGFLIHDATTIAPLSSLCSASMVHSWASSSGEKEPLHGMNFITTQYVHCWIFAVLQIHLSRLLNSRSIAPCSVNWSTLIGCPVGDIT